MARRSLEIVITGDSRGASRAFRGVEKDAGRLTGRLQGTGHLIRNTFAAFGAAYTAQAAIRAVGTSTIEFDKNMRNVNSIAQLSEKRFQGVSRAVLDLAGPTAQSPVKLAEGLYDLVSSGFNAAESLKILKSSANAATAGLTTTEVSTKAVAAVLNAYRKPADQAKSVSDVLFRTVDRGVISFEDLTETVGDVLPFAASLGVNLKSVGAATATMTKAGIGAPETMTRIKNVMVTMLKPGTALKDALQDLGYESGEAIIKQEGFEGALLKLINATDGSKASVAALFPNIRSLGGVLALTGDNARAASQDLEGMQASSGATARALEQQSKSIAFQWNRLKAGSEALAIELGQELAPAAGKVLDVLTDPGLSGEAKMNQLGDMLGNSIETALKTAPQLIEKAAPSIVGAGVILGKSVVAGVGQGFVESDLLGKLLIGGAVLRMFGGRGALIRSGATVGGLMGIGAGTAMSRSMTTSLATFGTAALMSGGGGKGMAKAGAAMAGGLAKNVAGAIGPAMATFAVADTAATAMSGDLKGAGAMAGGALVGGLIGMIGGPGGAMVGASIGSQLGEPILDAFDGIFDSGEKVKTLQERIADGTHAVARSVKAEASAVANLRGSSRKAATAQSAQTVSSNKVRRAERNLLNVRREYGPASRATIVAEGKLGAAKRENARATDRARKAQRLHGVMLQATKGVLRSSVVEEKAQITTLRQKRQGIIRALAVENKYRDGGKRQAQLLNALRGNTRKLNDTQGNLSKSLLRASTQVGPKFAKSLKSMSTFSANAQKALGQLPKPIKPLERDILGLNGTFKRFGSTSKDQMKKAGDAAKDFADKQRRSARTVKSSVTGMVGPVRTGYSAIGEDTNAALAAMGSKKKVAVAFRKGGRAGGTVPAMVSSGEDVVDKSGRTWTVPGQPVKRDNVFAQLPADSTVLTWDGKLRRAMGEPIDSIVKNQLPHFGTGSANVSRPMLSGGNSTISSGVGQRGIDMVRMAAIEMLKKIGGPRSLQAVKKAADRIDALKLSYVWGGSHGSTPANPNGPFDCSSAVSRVMQEAGWKVPTSVSGAMASWGEAGPGPVTIMANPEHVYGIFGGRAWGTSGENPGGGPGWIESYTTRPGFTVRHMPTGGEGQAPVQGFAGGGRVLTGSATWFNGGATAGGSTTSRPGLALNLNPGTDSGWNNETTQGWMDKSRAGNPVYADTYIGGKSARLPITDLGPAGWTGHAIDVTEGGVTKLGFSTSNFPSGTTGKVKILDENSKAVDKPKPATKGQRERIAKLRHRASVKLEKAQELKRDYKKQGGTKRGRKAVKAAISLARAAAKKVKAGDFEAAEDLIENSKKRIDRVKDLMEKARGGVYTPPTKPGKLPALGHKGYDKDDPFSMKNLPGWGAIDAETERRLKSPGLGWSGRYGVLENALASAQQTKTKKDDAAILNAQLGMSRGKRRALLQRVRRLNKRLRSRNLTAKQRAALGKQRDAALGELGSTEGSIAGIKESVRDLNETDSGSSDEGSSDLAASIEDLIATIKASDERREQFQAATGGEIGRAVRDYLSGQLVGKQPGFGSYNPNVRY